MRRTIRSGRHSKEEREDDGDGDARTKLAERSTSGTSLGGGTAGGFGFTTFCGKTTKYLYSARKGYYINVMNPAGINCVQFH